MTSKINLKDGVIEVDVIVFKEGKYSIAYVPALNLTSYSTVQKTAVDCLEDAVKLFMDYWSKEKKLHGKLIELGWKEVKKDNKKKMIPQKENFDIPYTLLDKDYSKTKMQLPAYC